MNSNILLVDDDAGSIQLMGRILSDLGNLQFATRGEDALRIARQAAPDLILLDAEMPGMSGFQVLDALKSEPDLADVPVIFVTSHSEASFEVAGFEKGAADFIAKPVNAALVLARVRAQLRVKRMADELRRKVSIDGLTGVANRRQFDQAVEREWLRARRCGDPLALLMVDLDHFKLYNDRHGHPNGDACLQQLAQALLGTCLRPGDQVARYGSDEFALLLPQTARSAAQRIAHRVLGAVEDLAIPHQASETAQHVTVSVGIACHDDASDASACAGESRDTGRDSGRGRGRLSSPAQVQPGAGDLVLAAVKALHCAKLGGRAQARLLDIAEQPGPGAAESAPGITPSLRAPPRGVPWT